MSNGLTIGRTFTYLGIPLEVSSHTKSDIFKFIVLRNEFWKDVFDEDGSYKISSLGRVKSIDRFFYRNGHKVNIKGSFMALSKNKAGYLYVRLRRNGEYYKILVHRLVAYRFIVNYPTKRTVNHKNGIKNDNSISNLEWNTHSENSIHSYNVLKTKAGMSGKTGALNKKSIPVDMFHMDGTYLKSFPGISEAVRNTPLTSTSGISKVCKNKLPHCGGYLWKYKKTEQ